MTRDRFATRQAILQSAADLIARSGISSLGINALAEAAGCDKVLIYRYFGGLDGVISALGAERTLWPKVELEGAGESLANVTEAALLEEWAELSSGALMLRACASELSSEGPLGRVVAEQRSAMHARLIADIRERHRVPPYVDLPAMVELLSAGLTMLALRAGLSQDGHSPETGSPALSIDPISPQGWRRIEKTLSALLRSALHADEA